MTWGRGLVGGPGKHGSLALLLVLAVSVVGEAREDAGRIDADLRQRLEEIAQRTAEIEDLTADFEQRKFTPLLREPLVSRGRVRVAGSRSRWETEAPRRTIAVIDPRRVSLYDPQRETIEVYEVGERLRGAVVTPLPRLDHLLENFRIERMDDESGPQSGKEADAPRSPLRLRLRLTPVRDALREHVDRLIVTLDTRTALARRVAWTDPDGERTVMNFSDPRINRGFSADDLKLDPPPGTKVVHPLRGVEEDDG